MPDRIDTTVKAMKPAGHHAPLDRTATQPERQELLMTHHPVLASGDLGHHRIAWAVLMPHTEFKTARAVYRRSLSRKVL